MAKTSEPTIRSIVRATSSWAAPRWLISSRRESSEAATHIAVRVGSNNRGSVAAAKPGSGDSVELDAQALVGQDAGDAMPDGAAAVAHDEDGQLHALGAGRPAIDGIEPDFPARRCARRHITPNDDEDGDQPGCGQASDQA